jgi:hypothetical protein
MNKKKIMNYSKWNARDNSKELSTGQVLGLIELSSRTFFYKLTHTLLECNKNNLKYNFQTNKEINS